MVRKYVLLTTSVGERGPIKRRREVGGARGVRRADQNRQPTLGG